MNHPDLPRPARSVSVGARVDARALLDAIAALRVHAPDDDFWSLFCACAGQLCRAGSVLALALQPQGWSVLGDFQAQTSGLDQRWPSLIVELTERLGDKGFAIVPSAGAAAPAIVVGVRLAHSESVDSVLLLEISEQERPRLNELVLRAQLIADVPLNAELRKRPASSVPSAAAESSAAGPQGLSVGQLLNWLDLVVRVTRHRDFGAAALALVNGLAAQTGWTQVVLGWRSGSYVRARAISHLDRFERRADHVRLLEAAMEETLDHDALVRDPGGDEALPAVAHARLRQGLGLGALVSMPMRDESESPQAVLLLAHDAPDAPEVQIEALQLAVQMAIPWLTELQEQDRWFGARWLHQVDRWAVEAVRIHQLGRKTFAILVASLLLYGIFGTWPHRVDANAELVTDSAQLLNSPFDGYMDQVLATAGDTVRQGEVLAVLDRQELLLQESEVRAEIRRFAAEGEKARAVGQTAEVQISVARRAQAQARLDRIMYQLEQARIMAPFDGVVVEGERRELLGAPVRRGDRLFRVARVEGLYVTLYVPEGDMRYITPQSRGEISLLSQPDRNWPIQVEAVIPVAQVKPQAGNLFMVRARLLGPAEPWWRPGMTGLARIDAGPRSILWLISRRAVDAIRLKLWW